MSDNVYDPHDLDDVLKEQKANRQIFLFTCPLCKKESFAWYRTKSYMECLNIDCKAMGVPTNYITKQIIGGKEINVFSPDGFRRLI